MPGEPVRPAYGTLAPADLPIERADPRSMESPAGAERPGLGSLLKSLVEGGADLVRHEARLAKVETADAAKGLALGVASVASGAVVALLGALALVAGIILLAGDQWLRDHYWLAALLMTALAGGLALFAAKRGLALLSPTQLAPTETVATLKEDKEWLKQLRT